MQASIYLFILFLFPLYGSGTRSVVGRRDLSESCAYQSARSAHQVVSPTTFGTGLHVAGTVASRVTDDGPCATEEAIYCTITTIGSGSNARSSLIQA
jgi:hypothetical protein